MDYNKLIERLSRYSEPVIAYKMDVDFAAAVMEAKAELEFVKYGRCAGCSIPITTVEQNRDLQDAPKLREEVETLRANLACVTAERDAAVEELENYMVQDVVDGNEPCGICAKASNIPCECCDPKWRGIKED